MREVTRMCLVAHREEVGFNPESGEKHSRVSA
jgi:hypothetical protein